MLEEIILEELLQDLKDEDTRDATEILIDLREISSIFQQELRVSNTILIEQHISHSLSTLMEKKDIHLLGKEYK